MAGIPRSFIDSLIDRADIVDVIDARVSLRKKGANYQACCPFHQEKTPSFSVSPSKQFYYCFGCGAHGNAIDFLMDYERLEFVEAVEELARYLGLDVPKEQAVANPKKIQKTRRIYDLLLHAQRLFQWQLRQHPQAKQSIDYLKQRGISGEIAKEYALGFAANSWDFLLKKLATSNEQVNLAYQAGLIVRHDQGRCYDRFRDRVMFPIRDMRGRTIGFGGRVLAKDAEPKYLNSPETPVFNKSEALYGIYEAKQYLNNFKRLLIVEGYMDVIALAQFDIRYALATLGTATTSEHIRRLLKQSSNLVFCYDGDQAGKEAAKRVLKVVLPFMGDNPQVHFLFLPDGEDPDSLIRQEGKEAFEKRIDQASSLSEFLFSNLTRHVDMGDLDGRAQLLQLAKPYIQLVPASAYRDLLVKRLSELTELAETQVSQRVRQTVKSFKRQEDIKRILSPIEQAIALLAQQPELIKLLQQPVLMEGGDYDLFNRIYQVIDSHQADSMPKVLLSLDEKGAKRAAHLASLKHIDQDENFAQEFVDVLKKISQEGLSQAMDKLVEKSKSQSLTTAEKKQIQKILQQNKK